MKVIVQDLFQLGKGFKLMIWARCENCDGLGAHYTPPYARTCENCKGLRGWFKEYKGEKVT